MRRIISILVTVVAIAVSAVAVGLSGPTPARASILPNYIVGGFAGASGCDLHGHAHEYIIQVTCVPQEGQQWEATNLTTWNSLHDGNVLVEELKLLGTNLCVNFGSSNLNFYLDSCVAGDANELFFQKQADSSGMDWWFINEAASILVGEASNEYYYLTATSFTEHASVVAAPPGANARAVWYISNS